MSKFESVQPRDMAMPQGDGGARAALISAGDLAAAVPVALDFASRGLHVMLLHRPADEAAALALALRIEAQGQHCELLSGDLDDAETCEEAAIHATFLGRGGVAAVVCVSAAAPGGSAWAGQGGAAYPVPFLDEALLQAEAGFWVLMDAVLPHLMEGAPVILLLSGPRADGSAMQRLVEQFADDLMATLRRAHGVRGYWDWGARGSLDPAAGSATSDLPMMAAPA
jgi:NAD(P)-dependent dehydrogenase (short-subunit alcohol dehydrogenase family)